MRKGSRHSLETRRRMSKNNAQYWKGKRHSLESRKKMSEAKKGKPCSVETWRKMMDRRRLSVRIKNHKKL